MIIFLKNLLHLSASSAVYLYYDLEPKFRVSQFHARVVSEDDISNATCVPIFVGSGSGWLKRSLN